nr:HAMP domain-containing sensor histidine kinase [Gemmiger qucibialis]
MNRISFQWRITLMTAVLIAGACICLNLLLYRSGATGMDNLNGYVLQYQQNDDENLMIEIPDDQMSDFLIQFSQEVYDAKAVFGRKGWCITAAVTLLSAAIAYFVSGKALEPLKKLARQAERIDQDSLVEVRLEENTIPEFRDLSQSVNRMLDRLAHSFDLQRQFAGNAAHELKTPLAIMQAKLEMFAEEHPDADSEITDLLRFQTDQVSRLASLVRTLLEMSDLQSIPREDHIELAPLADEIVADLTPLAQRRSITLFQECEDVSIK